MPICEICGHELKNPMDPRHIRSKRHQAALKKGKPISSATSTSSVRTTSSAIARPSLDFEKRLGLLEDQVKFILNKLTVIDVKLANVHPTSPDLLDLEPLKTRIKRLIRKGESVSIDELVKSRDLKSYKWNEVEKALLDLVDDEVFDVAEGRSKKKLAGNIGRLIRR